MKTTKKEVYLISWASGRDDEPGVWRPCITSAPSKAEAEYVKTGLEGQRNITCVQILPFCVAVTVPTPKYKYPTYGVKSC